MRKQIVAGNWKMNKTFEEADELINDIKDQLEEYTPQRNHLVVLCPPFPFLEMATDYSQESYFMVGAQDVSAHTSGAYTGEVAASMLQSMEIAYCIVGHSERRAYHGETDQLIAHKVDQLLAAGITPIVCCGEVLEEREAGKQLDIVRRQITDGLFHLTAEQIKNIVIAYEPVWAIGTGKTATPAQAQEIHAFIRSLLTEQYGEATAADISLLYGGSCKPANAAELFACPDIDGGLIGGASLKADDFMAIVKALPNR